MRCSIRLCLVGLISLKLLTGCAAVPTIDEPRLSPGALVTADDFKSYDCNPGTPDPTFGGSQEEITGETSSVLTYQFKSMENQDICSLVMFSIIGKSTNARVAVEEVSAVAKLVDEMVIKFGASQRLQGPEFLVGDEASYAIVFKREIPIGMRFVARVDDRYLSFFVIGAYFDEPDLLRSFIVEKVDSLRGIPR